MLQRVSFPAAGVDVGGTLHLPEGESVGGAPVLHGFGGHPDQPHVLTTCEALAAAGIAALRFPFRDHAPPRMTLPSALADVSGAIRLLKAHPAVRETLAIVGFSFGGAVAAIAAGRDSRIRATVLAAAPARFGDDTRWKPIAELSRTRSRVLLLWGSRDSEVPFADVERYAAVLRQGRVTTRVLVIEGADHDFGPAERRAEMAAATATWIREGLASPAPD